ncbi:MAG: TolC family protein [Phycisphaeraceae bacterium]|nr:TolC family protein [Phycisphaeraceae bacterium]
MKTRAVGRAGWSVRLLPCTTVFLSVLSGCASQRPDPRAEEAASTAAGLETAIAFRAEGGPLDEAADINSLTLADAVQRAVATDPRLHAALARVRIAMADADQARLLPNPVLDFVLRWGPGKPQFEVSLAQDLIQILRIPKQSSAADHRLRQAAADAVTVALDTVVEVQERYIAAQGLELLLPLLLERRELLDKVVATAKARLEAGEGTRSDLTILEAERVELDVDIAESRRQLRDDRLRLARLIGEPSGPAAWPLEPWSAPATALSSESEWIVAALANRPEVQSVAWSLAALGDEEALASFFPWDGAGFGFDAQRDEEFFIGPSISTPIPVFDTGQARRARASAEQIEARHDLTMARRMVVEEVRVAYQSQEAIAANLRRIRSELIPLQEQRRRQVEAAYQAGQSDVTPLFLAEQDLRAARARGIEAEQQLSLAAARLQRAVGGPGVARSVGHPQDSPSSEPPISSSSSTPTTAHTAAR